MKSWLFPLWVIIDILILLCALSLWIAAPEYLTLNVGLTIFGLSLALILVYARLSDVKLFLSSSYFKKASFHMVNVFLMIAIIGVVNYLGNKNYREFDLTKEKRNSLTDQTKKILESIDTPLKVTVFARREEWQGILNLLKLYEAASKMIKLEAVDTDLRPDLVQSKGITQNGSIVIEYKDKESTSVIVDELTMTNAILKATRSDDIVFYFVKGHQELSCFQKSPEGISQLCDKLRTQNYHLKEIDLSQTKNIPSDAAAIFILGPTSAFLKSEIDQIQAFINRGGSVFLALAPAFKSELYDNLTALAKPFGLTLGKDLVIDRLSTVQGAEATIPIISQYDPHHPVTAGFTQRTIFPLSSSVRILEGNDTAQLLAMTSAFPGSWAETDLKAVTKGKAEYKEGQDLKGPVGLLGVGEKTSDTKGSRFVLLGSSSFLINAYQTQSGNTTLFLNAVSWIANDEGIISFNRPGLEEEPVILSAQHLQLIFVISILLVPVVFFGAGIFVYRRRRIL
jgi:ABC-2 type transport system permease protein